MTADIGDAVGGLAIMLTVLGPFAVIAYLLFRP